MNSKTPLLPLYETSEAPLQESQTSCSPPDSLCSSLSSLSSVAVDLKGDCPPSQLIGSTAPPDKKHVKFVDDLGGICRPEPWSGEINCDERSPANHPYRASYGSINHHSILKEPSPCWSNKVGKEKSLHGYTNGPRRIRIRLRRGFSSADISERQKLSPLVCLLGSFAVMVIVFLWFLNGGDSHLHKHKEKFKETIDPLQHESIIG